MRFEILTVGTELTLGLSVDTNSADLACLMAREGMICSRQTSVADDLEEIAAAIKEAFSRTDVLIITGGLGPTFDDLTRNAISLAFKRDLVFQPEIAEMLKAKFATFGQDMPKLVLRQAYLPEGATAIVPSLGTAPGIVLRESGRMVIALPGVPREVKEMCDTVVKVLKKEFKPEPEVVLTRIIKTYGASEASVEEKVEDIMKGSRNPQIGILAHLGEVHLELIAKARNKAEARRLIQKTENMMKKRLGELIFGFDDDSLELVVGRILKKNSLSLSVAESCTGGLLGNKLTEVPGSSDYFLGGVTAYANEMKVRLVGVAKNTIATFGAVSAETALEMARGIRKSSGADIGLSTTGIAGPGGGSKAKPVGLVYIGLSSPWEEKTERFLFPGQRHAVKTKAAGAALNLLRLSLKDQEK